MLTAPSRKQVLVDPSILRSPKQKIVFSQNIDPSPPSLTEAPSEPFEITVVSPNNKKQDKSSISNNANSRFSRPPSAEITKRNSSSGKNLSSNARNLEKQGAKGKNGGTHFSLSQNNFFNYFAYKSMKNKMAQENTKNMKNTDNYFFAESKNGNNNNCNTVSSFGSPKNNMMRRLTTASERDKQNDNIDGLERESHGEDGSIKQAKNKYNNIFSKKSEQEGNKENNSKITEAVYKPARSPVKTQKIVTMTNRTNSPSNKCPSSGLISMAKSTNIEIPLTVSQDLNINNEVSSHDPLQTLNNILLEIKAFEKQGDYNLMRSRLQDLENKIGDLKTSIDIKRNCSIPQFLINPEQKDKDSFVCEKKTKHESNNNFEKRETSLEKPSIKSFVTQINKGQNLFPPSSKAQPMQASSLLSKYPRTTTNAETKFRSDSKEKMRSPRPNTASSTNSLNINNNNNYHQANNNNHINNLQPQNLVIVEEIPEEPNSINHIIHSSRMIGRGEVGKSKHGLKHVYYMNNVITAFYRPLKNYEEQAENNYFTQLCNEHLIQSFQAIHFSKAVIEGMDDNGYKEKAINLTKRPTHKDKKTLIFDLDETLVHCNENTELPADVILPIMFPNGQKIEAGINIRPHTREILKELNEIYEIIVFTASHSCYANVVLDYLDPQNEYIHHRMFREHCVASKEGMYIKDLRVIKNREMSDMIIVDNASYSFAFQRDNGIPILPYYDFKGDKELLSLSEYLKEIVNFKNVRDLNRKTFKLSVFEKYEDAGSVVENELKEFLMT